MNVLPRPAALPLALLLLTLACLPPRCAAGETGIPRVQRGDIDAGGGVRPARGLALGFAEGTVLFDADRLQAVAFWTNGFVRSAEQPYFGKSWAKDGAGAADTAGFPAPGLRLQTAADAPWRDFTPPLQSDPNDGTRFEGYQTGTRAVRLRYRLDFGDQRVSVTEDVRAAGPADTRGLSRSFTFTGLPAGAVMSLSLPAGEASPVPGVTTRRRAGDAGQEVRIAGGADGFRWELDGPRHRLVSAPAVPGSPLRLDITTRTSSLATPLTEAEIRALDVRPPELAGDFDRPVAPPAALPSPDPATAAPDLAPLRPELNREEFNPVKTRRVRLTVEATNTRDGAGMDELEVFGPGGGENLALRGTASASSVIPGYPIHQIAHLNDGEFGNPRSWVAGAVAAWVQIEWAEPVEIAALVWARDRTGKCRDRLATGYRVEVDAGDGQWVRVSDARRHGAAIAPPKAGVAPGYALETIPLPFPQGRASDVAFDGRGGLWLLEMAEGELWRSPLPAPGKPEQAVWRRFASGLHQPIGLQIVDGRIFVAQKPEITELLDRDGNGEADQYRTAASGWGLSHGWHEYTFGLGLDASRRHLWFTLNTGIFWTHPGLVNPGRHRGGILRLGLADGRLEPVARGCRVPNGIAAGPGEGMYFTDNQGDWIAACKLARIEPGRFYGHPESEAEKLAPGAHPDGLSSVWLPYLRSRSTSGPVLDDTGGRFGPFGGQLFVGDVGYGGNPGVLRVDLEPVDGVWQGACFRFMDDLPLGCERLKFGPDGCLYQASLSTGLTVVRPEGPLPFALHSVRIRPRGEGFVLHLTAPLAAEYTPDPAAFRCRRYHYVYSGAYGSPETGAQDVSVTAAAVSPDRRSITLTLPVTAHAHGMVHELNAGPLPAAAGGTLAQPEAWYTVHRIPE